MVHIFRTLLGVVFVLWSIACVIAGAAIGVASGWLTSFLTLKDSGELRYDALMGSCGFFVGFWGCLLIARSYKHPIGVAVVAAIVLPVLYQLSRLIPLRQDASGGS